jgi:cobalt/nickel transport system permease protein
MSHIHIPDGVLPVWLWVLGWVAAFAVISVASARAARAEARRSVPLIGAVSALVLIAMSTEIVPIAYHINLTVIAGVLLGPWLGAISAFIVVLVLALLGHGGITVVGLNTLVIAAEIAIGWALVKGGLRLLGRPRISLVAGVATVVTLALTTTMLVGIVAIGGAPATARETGALDPETLHFGNPFSGGVVSLGLLGGSHEHEEADDHADEEDEHAGEAEGGLSVGRFAAVVYTLGPIGGPLEALVTAGILGYVARVRPTLVLQGALAENHRSHYGDEHGGR